jgi:hypothetical protein
MHWAELQFERFRTYSEADDISSRIGVVAHWLAAEYVVLEGYMELGLHHQSVARLLSAYPEHKDLLRRCRNAVYHFQKSPIDPRIAKVLKDEDEELRWCSALHFELQGVLLQLVDALRSGSVHQREIVPILVRSIGWFPKHPYAEEADRLSATCAEYEDLLKDDSSIEAEAERLHMAVLRRQMAELDMYPMSSALLRLLASADKVARPNPSIDRTSPAKRGDASLLKR